MKILGGKLKGRNFYMPAGIRPTVNMARKAVFDLMGHEMAGIQVLDLFAGSGAVGLEALSWGAKEVTFVEKDPKCLKVIEENCYLLGLDHYELIALDAFMAVKRMSERGRKFDVIFADPPYGRGLARKLLKTLEAYDIVRPKSLVIIEHKKKETLPSTQGRFSVVRQRNYGLSALTVLAVSQPNSVD